MNKRRGLGRGLEALIPSGEYAEDAGLAAPANGFTLRVAIHEIRPNPEQPRRNFDPLALQELADSIRLHGVLQPLLVRELAQGYELIAGERRLRAAQLAGLTAVPVMIHQGQVAGVGERLELSLIENLQRADLNPIEEARAIQRLLDEFGLTQEAVAERLARDRSVVAHSVRLLALPDGALRAIETGAISAGHGKALLGLPTAAQQLAGLNRILEESWSVRQAEEWVRSRRGDRGPRRQGVTRTMDADTAALEEEFRRALGTKVVLTRLRTGGRLTIEFYSDGELEVLRHRLTRS